jgi:hypothetical protein
MRYIHCGNSLVLCSHHYIHDVEHPTGLARNTPLVKEQESESVCGSVPEQERGRTKLGKHFSS